MIDWLNECLIEWFINWCLINWLIGAWLIEWLIAINYHCVRLLGRYIQQGITDWLIDWLNDGLIDWVNEWWIDWCLIDWWLNEWWIDCCLIDWWLSEWLIEWLIDRLNDWCLMIDWMNDWLPPSVIVVLHSPLFASCLCTNVGWNPTKTVKCEYYPVPLRKAFVLPGYMVESRHDTSYLFCASLDNCISLIFGTLFEADLLV